MPGPGVQGGFLPLSRSREIADGRDVLGVRTAGAAVTERGSDCQAFRTQTPLPRPAPGQRHGADSQLHVSEAPAGGKA